jgi:hypothetical protein
MIFRRNGHGRHYITNAENEQPSPAPATGESTAKKRETKRIYAQCTASLRCGQFFEVVRRLVLHRTKIKEVR